MKTRIEECTGCGEQVFYCNLCDKYFAAGDKIYCEGKFGGDYHICKDHVFQEERLVHMAEVEA